MSNQAVAPPLDLDTTTPDPGLFGPDSISWRIHHDPSAFVGGLRALMLQSLHPQVMRGFYAHTSAEDDPWGRLFRTAGYVNTVVYGTTEEAQVAGARVRRVHAALGLDDQDWLLWVHCGAVDSWIEGQRRSGGRLTAAEADQYVAEHVTLATLTGIEVDRVPTNVAELGSYFDSVRDELSMTDEAREVVRGLVWPPMQPRLQWLTPARPIWTVAAATAYGLLPGWSRSMLALRGFPSLPTTELQATLTARTLRAGLLVVPEARRTSPHVAAARQRLAL